ncbi:MAG TPA: cytochrome c [Kiloniellales bacterium]|jgi:mono/diheme cytochrome c family protein
MAGRSKRHMGWPGLLGAAAVLAVAALAFYLSGFASAVRQDEPGRLARGHELYATYCAACHGVNREGQANWQQRGADGLLPAPPHDETGHTWHHPDQQLFQIIKLGTAALVGGDYKTTMIGFGDKLSDDEIMAILDYIKSTWPEPIGQRQAEITARAGQAQ